MAHTRQESLEMAGKQTNESDTLLANEVSKESNLLSGAETGKRARPAEIEASLDQEIKTSSSSKRARLTQLEEEARLIPNNAQLGMPARSGGNSDGDSQKPISSNNGKRPRSPSLEGKSTDSQAGLAADIKTTDKTASCSPSKGNEAELQSPALNSSQAEPPAQHQHHSKRQKLEHESSAHDDQESEQNQGAAQTEEQKTTVEEESVKESKEEEDLNEYEEEEYEGQYEVDHEQDYDEAEKLEYEEEEADVYEEPASREGSESVFSSYAEAYEAFESDADSEEAEEEEEEEEEELREEDLPFSPRARITAPLNFRPKVRLTLGGLVLEREVSIGFWERNVGLFRSA